MLEVKDGKMLFIRDMQFLEKSRVSYLTSTESADVILTTFFFFLEIRSHLL